jgi:uncharacterized membrane protein
MRTARVRFALILAILIPVVLLGLGVAEAQFQPRMVDVYRCRRCGREFRVPHGTPMPECPCRNDPSVNSYYSSRYSGTSLVILLVFVIGGTLLPVGGLGAFFLIRFIVKSAARRNSSGLPPRSENKRVRS